MRLKTKFQDEDFNFGEVVKANIYYGGDGRVKLIAEAAKGGNHTFYFETLKGMNEMFEDAPEEPKDYWYITEDGTPGRINLTWDTQESIKYHKEIGNYFNTYEEAEKAVEKLKAWKRLKDKGFRFIDHIDRDNGQGMTRYEWNGYINGEDLDLILGGEE